MTIKLDSLNFINIYAESLHQIIIFSVVLIHGFDPPEYNKLLFDGKIFTKIWSDIKFHQDIL